VSEAYCKLPRLTAKTLSLSSEQLLEITRIRGKYYKLEMPQLTDHCLGLLNTGSLARLTDHWLGLLITESLSGKQLSLLSAYLGRGGDEILIGRKGSGI
jgi:hypothetical protein